MHNMATPMKLDDDLKERILAQAQQRSAHWIWCEAIRSYIEHKEKLEAYKQEAIKAWESYQKNGQHVTQEEADAWLAQLEAGEDVEPPECHN
jgi:predicted transcriptional regulator